MRLRPRQKTFVERSVAALASRGNTLGVAPTGAGNTLMLSAIRGALEAGVDVGLVQADSITVAAPEAADQSTTDRGNRHYPGITFGATLKGAIHTMAITGNLAP